MPTFSLTRLQNDLAGGRLTAAAVNGYVAVFSAFSLGQLRHLSGRLGLADPADRDGAIDALADRLRACMSDDGGPPAGNLTTDAAGSVSHDEAHPPPPPEKLAEPAAAAPPAGPGGPGGPGGPPGGPPEAAPGGKGGKCGKGGKTGKTGKAVQAAGAVFASPGSNAGDEGMPLWENEGGPSPGKGDGRGGKTGGSVNPGSAPGGKTAPAVAAGPGVVADPANPTADEPALPPDDGGIAPPDKSGGKCPGCPGGKASSASPVPAAMAVADDGDDDSGPVTPEHVLAEASANGVTHPDAARLLAGFAAANPGMTHTQLHAAYDLVGFLAAGGGMSQPEAAARAVAYGSLAGLRDAAGRGDALAAKVLARVPADAPAEFWAGVVLADGRPRTRLAAMAGCVAAGVPAAYADRYVTEVAAFDLGGEWVSVPGRAGTVRFRVGPGGRVTAGPAGLYGRPAAQAVTATYQPLVRAAAARAAASGTGVAAFDFGGGGVRPAGVGPGTRPAAPCPGGKDRHGKGGKTAGGFGGLLCRLARGGRTGFSDGPATTGLYAALTGRAARSRAAAHFAAAAARATPAGMAPGYYWDELVYGPHGRTVRLAVLADGLDAGHSPDSAAALARTAPFAQPGRAPGRRIAGYRAPGYRAPVAAFDKSGGGGDDDGQWMTISGAAGTTHICIDGDGHITKGPKGLVGRPVKEALSDTHHEAAAAAQQKAKEKREARKAASGDAKGGDAKGKDEHGQDDHGKAGASHGDAHHHGHGLAHKITHAAHHIETAVHFLLHPGGEAAAVAATKVFGGRYKKVKDAVHRGEEKIRQRYGKTAGTLIVLAGIGGSFGASMAVPGIGHYVIPATPGSHLVAAIPVIAAAEAVLQSKKAAKFAGAGIAKGYNAAKGAAKSLGRLFRKGEKAVVAPPQPVGPKSKAQAKALAHANARKVKKKSSGQSQFAAVDPGQSCCDVPNAVIVREGKKFWAQIMREYAADLKNSKDEVREMCELVNAAHKRGKAAKAKAKKADFSAAPDADANPDDAGKAIGIAHRLSRHAKAGKLTGKAIGEGLSELHGLPTQHVHTAARTLGIGGPLGGKAKAKKKAIARIAAHLRTHAKAAAAEMHAAAGLPACDAGDVILYEGRPRTREWVAHALRSAGVPAAFAASYLAAAPPLAAFGR